MSVLQNKNMSVQYPPSIIATINEQQSEYRILRLINEDEKDFSQNAVFYGYRIVKPSVNDKNKSIIQPQSGETFAFKLLEVSKMDKDKYTRIHNTLHLFSDDPRVIQNQKVHIIRCKFNKYILIPTKYYPKKDLYEYIFYTSSNQIAKPDIIRIATFQALHILILLKKRNIVHNDFKFENLMVTEEPIPIQPHFPFYILVFDFDESEEVPENGKAKIIAGTTIFNPPEVQKGLPHDYSTDIWSLGVNIYYYFCYNLPFGIIPGDSPDTIYEKQSFLRNDLFQPQSIPEDAFECIYQMLRFEPEDRITPEEALQLKWFEGLSPIVPMRVDSFDTKSETNNETI